MHYSPQSCCKWLQCACSTESVYSQCKEKPLHLLGLIADVLYNTLRNNQWCSVWLSCLAADLSWQGKQSWWSTLMRQEKPMVEAKQNSHPHLPGSLPSLSLGWNCEVTWGPGLKGMQKAPPSFVARWLCFSRLYSNLSDNIRPSDPFVQIVIAVSVFFSFSMRDIKEGRNSLKGLVSNNVGTCMLHTDTHTDTADALDFLRFSVLRRYGGTSHSSDEYSRVSWI